MHSLIVQSLALCTGKKKSQGYKWSGMEAGVYLLTRHIFVTCSIIRRAIHPFSLGGKQTGIQWTD